MSPTVTRNDILAEIQKALDSLPQTEGPKGITIGEFAKAKRVSRQKAADILNQLRAQGKITAVRLQRKNLFDQPYFPWGFQLQGKKS